ncbi:hypothetical protein [Streptomyces cadmiisoli]|uniref:hypothetical protein n=1 Tax=Streptomyces cadmiisoli TaxID=2184053 RepID=UPI00365C4E45
MTDTQVLQQTIALGDDPDSIRFEEQLGHTFIVLGNVSLALSLSSQAAIDKLATIAARAAADNRARSLREVA